MKKSIVLLAAAALPLGACTSYNGDSDTLASAGTGAAIGAAAGAGVSAVAGTDLLTSAAIGAAAGGLAGAVWADRNRDGRADGYVYQNRYYAGTPDTYQPGMGDASYCPSVGGTALKTGVAGAAVGAGAGALIGGLGVLEGAAIGAAVGGLGGAIWADQNRDGCIDGYVREGQYYAGVPAQQPVNTTYTGERG
ncbi:hypothetical protein GCM10011515_19950 [Tsuneonella deserti]|uniref:Glycine zipper domain-containing protein n=1 Tax=Tsuneonella deserti TaxID=2035528 RepID=A0ABQ1SB06_9SPHN|nr:hypothetical protein [Tsuneonella deserti]GGE00177.1 hypothetical protein GCM10011515_19950 [Tsuneonella deserti]